MEQKKSGKCLVIIDSCIIYFGHQYSVTLSFTCGHSLYDQFLIGMMFFTRVNDLVMKMWGKKIACIWNSLSYFFHTSYKWHRKILDERRKYIKELLEKKKERRTGLFESTLGKRQVVYPFHFSQSIGWNRNPLQKFIIFNQEQPWLQWVGKTTNCAELSVPCIPVWISVGILFSTAACGVGEDNK